MILLWHFYWPVIAAGLLIGFITGKVFYGRIAITSPEGLAGLNRVAADKRRKRNFTFVAGAAAALICALLWHGPLGAGARLTANVEVNARTTLGYYEMQVVDARLERSPLRRRLVLSGPSDDVQQRELKRIMNEIPGVSDVQWANPPTAPVWMK